MHEKLAELIARRDDVRAERDRLRQQLIGLNLELMSLSVDITRAAHGKDDRQGRPTLEEWKRRPAEGIMSIPDRN